MAPRPPRRAQDELQYCSMHPEPQDGPHAVPICPNTALRRLQVAKELTKEVPKRQNPCPTTKGHHCVDVLPFRFGWLSEASRRLQYAHYCPMRCPRESHC
eukprot:4237627-Pyramimonas_sp.AAC.1